MTGVTFVYVEAKELSDGSACKGGAGLLTPDTVAAATVQQERTQPSTRARYTRAALKSTLQAAGCKPWVAHKASKGVFMALNIRLMERGEGLDMEGGEPDAETALLGSLANPLPRHEWIGLVMTHVAQHTDSHLQLEDFEAASSIHERRRSVAVLLAGTSGCGKSTLAGLLAARLGITTLISTDSIRHMMRSFVPQESNPVLWASTYEAGDCMKARASSHVDDLSDQGRTGTARHGNEAKQRAVEGYTAQSEIVYASLDALLGGCAARRESLVIEGVLLSMDSIMRLMSRHPTIMPFLVHISSEAKHRERFAVRAKYMTLDAGANRYVHYLGAIRAIQEHLVDGAMQYRIPAVNNTNVDRSVAIIHATVLACLRRRAQGETMLDSATYTAAVVAREYAGCVADSWSSKRMLQIIRRKAARASTLGHPTTPSAALSPLPGHEDDAEEAHSGFDGHSQLLSSDGGSVSNEGASHDGGEASTAAATRMDGSVLETEIDLEDHVDSNHHTHA